MSNTRHTRRNRILTLAVIPAIGLGALLTAAVPAMAATTDGPVNATVTVPTTITLSLDTSTLAFGTVNPGATSATQPLTVTIVTNDSKGYDANWTPANPGSDNFSGGPGASFPVGWTSGGAGMFQQLHSGGTRVSSDGVVLVATGTGPSAASGDSTAWDFGLTVPGNAPGASYSAGPFMVIAAGR